MSITEFEDALRPLTITPEDAVFLTGALRSSADDRHLSTLGNCIYLYLESLKDVVKDLTHGFRQAINLHGTATLQIIQPKPEHKYAATVARLLLISHATVGICFSRHISSNAVEALFLELSRQSHPIHSLSSTLHACLHHALSSLLTV